MPSVRRSPLRCRSLRRQGVRERRRGNPALPRHLVLALADGNRERDWLTGAIEHASSARLGVGLHGNLDPDPLRAAETRVSCRHQTIPSRRTSLEEHRLRALAAGLDAHGVRDRQSAVRRSNASDDGDLSGPDAGHARDERALAGPERDPCRLRSGTALCLDIGSRALGELIRTPRNRRHQLAGDPECRLRALGRDRVDQESRIRRAPGQADRSRM